MAYEQFVYFCGMQWIKRIFDFYLKASIHVALSVVSLAYVGFQSLNIIGSPALGVVLFSATVMGYNFIKYGLGGAYFIKVSNKSFLPMQALSFLCGAMGVYGLLSLNTLSYLTLLILLVFTVLYALPVFPSQRNLRAFRGLKIYIVAFVWAAATVILPLTTVGKSLFIGESNGLSPQFTTEGLAFQGQSVQTAAEPFFGMAVLGLFLSHFFLVLALMVPFEIRDYLIDTPALKTLPQRYGIKKAQRIGILWAFLFVLFAWFSLGVFGVAGLSYMPSVFVVLLLFWVLYWSPIKKSVYFTNFWVESIPIFYALSWEITRWIV